MGGRSKRKENIVQARRKTLCWHRVEESCATVCTQHRHNDCSLFYSMCFSSRFGQECSGNSFSKFRSSDNRNSVTSLFMRLCRLNSVKIFGAPQSLYVIHNKKCRNIQQPPVHSLPALSSPSLSPTFSLSLSLPLTVSLCLSLLWGVYRFLMCKTHNNIY